MPGRPSPARPGRLTPSPPRRMPIACGTYPAPLSESPLMAGPPRGFTCADGGRFSGPGGTANDPLTRARPDPVCRCCACGREPREEGKRRPDRWGLVPVATEEKMTERAETG